ncbi:hypothetical protein RHOM_15720 [Roseburia hominis A2-183]|uniref:Uncharacterized protein n=1 Tax=Roseburia hominis (strain DSM 16839 / JCM 17582 / NCIMB 14029 / A2-183) TaxID=585394 RepID=G2T5U2_ROSHA|nr:hypothetical protein RHOM_15720 [Roseburia hominis A2-183]
MEIGLCGGNGKRVWIMLARYVKRMSQIAVRSRGNPLFKFVQVSYNIEEIGQGKV